MKQFNLIAAILFLLGLNAFAQDNYKMAAGKGKNMVKGTSTLHDWRCVAEQQGGNAVINTDGTFEIKSLNARIVAKSLRSVKENGSYYDEAMDKNTHKALKADQFPEIVYTLISASNIKSAGNTTTFTAQGHLTIAGKTNKVTFPVKAVQAGNAITFTGVVPFKLTAFGITPPKALMGTVKTGDDVTVVLNATYVK